jgi:uncharacterized phage protein (TIGR01671 family)
MREILFRGKTAGGKWVHGSLVHRTQFYGDPCDDYLILVDGEFHCDYYDADEVITETIGQFTGLFDKNGKKIFEGDIIKNEYEVGKNQYFRITYNEDSMRWSVMNKYRMQGHLCHVLGSMEVIGNIYDNPELLEV